MYHTVYVCPKQKPRSCNLSPPAILPLEFQFFFSSIEKFKLYGTGVYLHTYCNCGKSLQVATGFSGMIFQILDFRFQNYRFWKKKFFKISDFELQTWKVFVHPKHTVSTQYMYRQNEIFLVKRQLILGLLIGTDHMKQ